jgi:CRP-like cAMP-binding protein
MISPEYLKQYRIFSVLNPDQLKHIAELAEEVSHESGDILFYEGDKADALYVLVEGLIELYYSVDVEYHPELHKELKFREIHPGELFSISAMIEPYELTASARAVEPSRMIKIHAAQLLEWCEEDFDLANALMRQVASAAITRLQATREQLGAARAALTL